MKPFHVRGVLAAAALLTFSSGAMAQNNSYYNPSILPLPDSRPVTQTAYQAPQTGPLGGYRQSLTSANQEAVDAPPAQAGSSAVPDSAADDASSSINGKWWKPWSTSSSDTTGTGTSAPTMGGCGSAASCMTCNPCCSGARWFGSVGGLFMTRNTPNPFWTTYNTNNLSDQVLNTKQAGNGLWGGGGQVTFGRWWCPCGCNNSCNCGPQYAYGMQFTYWQIADMTSSASVFNAGGNLATPIDFTGPNPVTFNGNPAEPFFDGAYRQSVWRTDRFLNIELNGLVQPIYNNPGRCSVALLAGFRYFRFQDILTYGSAKDPSGDFNAAGGADAAYQQSNVTNNLFGAQIGTLLNVAVTPNWGFFVLPKAGVFGNQINVTNSMYTGNGIYGYNYHASQATVSLLGELDTGVYWWMCPNAQLFFGWRVVGVSNVALADNQFLPYAQDVAGFHSVKPNGDLILTGGFGGVAFAF